MLRHETIKHMISTSKCEVTHGKPQSYPVTSYHVRPLPNLGVGAASLLRRLTDDGADDDVDSKIDAVDIILSWHKKLNEAAVLTLSVNLVTCICLSF